MKNMLPLLTLLTLVFTLTGCQDNRISSVERENLFSLEIGPMEDQIALYQLEGSRGIKRTGFTMHEGLFYIADGTSGKIVRYNSYGDLLFMIYNEETNPPPISLKTNISENEQVTRWAFSHPLRELGWIAVDSRKHIFVEDRLLQQDHRFDAENNVLLDGVILHFDQDGRYVNYLGREGIGGSPFPRIIGLGTSEGDELAVICRLPGSWNIYWFSASGQLLFFVKINANAIPSLPDKSAVLEVLDSIYAAPDARKLYLKVDYYRDTFDQSTNTRTGSEPARSVIWTLNVEDGSYINSLEVPLYELEDSSRQSEMKMFYSMIGAARGGRAMFYFPVDAGYSILFLDTNTREQRRGFINFSIDELKFNDFYLSSEGILTAMLVDDFRAKIVWWRTDRFMGDAQ